MVKKKASLIEKLDNKLGWDKKTIGHFFLGVGLIMFILNITTILNFIQYTGMGFPMTGYYTSTASSMFLMGYSLYNIYVE